VVIEPAAIERPPDGGSLPRREPVPAAADYTENGLPRRVRQANLAEPLREPPPDPAGEDASPAGGRSPEQVRAMMSSYQRGTQRGRSDDSSTDAVDG
jgi:hypothetical protein